MPGTALGGAPTCRPAHVQAIYPPSEREHAFPTYEANILQQPRTLDFQVCDSAVGDLNQDGRPEILVADHISPGYGFFPNDPAFLGGRIFRDGVHVTTHGKNSNSAGVVVADFNADGKLDVANSNHPGTVTVNVNQTEDGSFDFQFAESGEIEIDLGIQEGPEYGLVGREGGLVAADFNGDGRPDIATADLGETVRKNTGYAPHCPQGARDSSRHATTILINTTEPGAAKASFAAGEHFPLVGPAISIDSADFNFDGKMDLVTADTNSSSLSVLTNRTEQNGEALPCFTAAQQLMIPDHGLDQGAGPTNPVAIDLNADGKPDIASANWNVRTVTFWINLTDEAEAGSLPRFSEPAVVSTGKLPPLVLQASDLDNDGLNDIVVIPLSTHSNAAMMVLRNESTRGGDTAVFEVDAVYPIPKKLENRWLYTYFSSAGAVHDYDGDGVKDIGVVVARGSLLLKLMKAGNNILKYVDPGVPLWTVHPILPNHSMLIVYRREGSPGADSSLPVCEDPATLDADPSTCDTARHVLASLSGDVVELHAENVASGMTNPESRASQADYSADRLREIAANSPPSLRADLELVANHVDDSSDRLLTEPSWHIDHDVDDAVDRITVYLHENCGD